jgi:hypothetical protein
MSWIILTLGTSEGLIFLGGSGSPNSDMSLCNLQFLIDVFTPFTPFTIFTISLSAA